MSERRVLLLGATGLVGSELLKLLLADASIERVIALTRKALPAVPKLEQHPWGAALPGGNIHQVFCALGTTIRKAGSQDEFRRIDHDLPVQIGREALQRGATHYLLVSALGASSQSRVFYNRVKGETENAITALGYRSVTIARPSLLLGPRTERRLGEEIAKKFAWLMPGKYRAIEAHDVARALVNAAREDAAGVRILESSEMQPKR